MNLLPVACWIKLLRGCKLIYTPHELETEKTGQTRTSKFVAKLIEKLFIRFANKVLVVCEPIADWYERTYTLENTYVLRNVPINPYTSEIPLSKSTVFRVKFGIKEEDIIFIYQGLLSDGRDLEEIIEIFKTMPSNKHLILMGYGDRIKLIQSIALEYKNIHFHPAVPLEQIIEHTSGADVGLFLLFNKPSLSYQYSLPNKFSEYIIAEIPILVTNHTTYLTDIISKQNCGWSLPPDKEIIRNFILSIKREDIENIKKSVCDYAHNLGWQFEDKVLKEIYDC